MDACLFVSVLAALVFGVGGFLLGYKIAEDRSFAAIEHAYLRGFNQARQGRVK